MTALRSTSSRRPKSRLAWADNLTMQLRYPERALVGRNGIEEGYLSTRPSRVLAVAGWVRAFAVLLGHFHLLLEVW